MRRRLCNVCQERADQVADRTVAPDNDILGTHVEGLNLVLQRSNCLDKLGWILCSGARAYSKKTTCFA